MWYLGQYYACAHVCGVLDTPFSMVDNQEVSDCACMDAVLVFAHVMYLCGLIFKENIQGNSVNGVNMMLKLADKLYYMYI